MDLQRWKNLTLPWEKGNDGQMRHSKCKMIDPKSGNETTCQYGWEYDTTDYSSTIPSEFNWVCERDYYATDCFSWRSIGSAIGNFVFGIMTDKFGRKPVFFLSCAVSSALKISSLFLAHHYFIYKFLQLLDGLSTVAIITIPALLCAEVSGTNYRSWIYAVTWMIWVAGNGILPFISCTCRGWFLFGIVTAAPGLALLFYYPFVDESARWLISTGRTAHATGIVLKIAKRNGVNVDIDELTEMVEQLAKKQAKDNQRQSVGVWTLFSKFRVAKNTVMLTIAWTMNNLLYYGVTINATKMAGHKFLNYFLLALMEIPGGFMAGKLAELTGRRWTQAGFFLLAALSCLICAVAVAFPNSALIVIIAALGIKFAVFITELICYLEGAEIFPTQLRSTGAGLAATVANALGVFGPYIVYSGTVHVSFPYALLCMCCVIGFMSSSWLPETLKQNLPETIEDANNFGKDHQFFSYLPQARRKSMVAAAVVEDGPKKRRGR